MSAAALPRGVRLILASASPRRSQILREHGYRFECADPGAAEEAVSTAPTPEMLAMEKARAKAAAVAASLPGPYPALVLGVDTLVAAGDAVIGKPLDRADAVAILSRLAGTRHRVISGLCAWPLTRPAVAPAEGARREKPLLYAETTWVSMRRMARQEIEAYAATGEADGKAGAYAVQENGDRFVEKIEGSFLNVVGFPLEMFERRLEEMLRSLQV